MAGSPPRAVRHLNRVMAARRERLAELSAQWPAQQREQLTAVLHQLARELLPLSRRAA